jgi:hypothetical protein
MKKLIIIIINSTIIIISGILICFFSLPSKIDIVAEDSFFSDYEVINDEVMFYCTITFKNDYNEDKVINIFASSDEDIETGLLAEARMPGYKSDDFESVFLIPASSQGLITLFLWDNTAELLLNMTDYCRI